jgi:hypothetical protein
MSSSEDKGAYVQHLLAQLNGAEDAEETGEVEADPVKVIIVGMGHGADGLALYSSIKDRIALAPTPTILVVSHHCDKDNDITALITEAAQLQSIRRVKVHPNKGQRKANRQDRWR